MVTFSHVALVRYIHVFWKASSQTKLFFIRPCNVSISGPMMYCSHTFPSPHILPPKPICEEGRLPFECIIQTARIKGPNVPNSGISSHKAGQRKTLKNSTHKTTKKNNMDSKIYIDEYYALHYPPGPAQTERPQSFQAFPAFGVFTHTPAF